MRLRDLKRYDYLVILPDDKFKAYWDVLITLLILAVSILTPLRIAFQDDDPLAWVVVDSAVDAIFCIDIVLNFFFAYYDDEYNLKDERSAIARSYLTSWFVVDVISVIPVSVVFHVSDYNSLFRLARISRLHRIVKLTRLVRMLKIVKERHKLAKYLHEILRIGESFERLLFFFLSSLVGQSKCRPTAR